MNHTEFIQEIIQTIQNKEKISKSDFHEPIKNYYDHLNERDKKQFKKELVDLLDVVENRSLIISICRDLYVAESAEKIYQLVTNKQSEEPWFNNAITALGVLRYTPARDFLKFCLDSLEIKDENTTHYFLLGLIPIDPLGSTPYVRQTIISDSKQNHIYHGNYLVPDILGAFKKSSKEAKKIMEEYDKHQELYAMVPTKQYLQYLLQAGGKKAIYKLTRELRSVDFETKEFFVQQLSYAIDWIKNGWLPLEGPIITFRGSKGLLLNNVKLIIYTFRQLLEVRIKETFTFPKNNGVRTR